MTGDPQPTPAAADHAGWFPDLDRELDRLAALHELHPAPVDACRAMTWQKPRADSYRGPEQPLPTKPARRST